MSKSLDDILDAADFPYRDVPVCLKGSLRARYEEAQARLDALIDEIEATKSPDGKVQATSGKLRAKRQAAEDVQALEAEMAEHTVTFHIVGRPFPDYNSLLIKHPPRDGNLLDRALGYNTSTFHPANIRASVQTPEMSDAQWEKLVTRLTDGQFDQLANAAVEVNRRSDDGSVPFSFSASEAMRDSDETSSSPDSSE